jgi:conjugal transfer mating pair stabilization protein TraG
MAEGGAEGIADRARNERLTRIVEGERLTRMQRLLKDHGVTLSKREIAMAQNGDISLNVTPAQAAQLWRGGLINESQLGAIANGGTARFSFAHNDLLVSSATSAQQSARNDTSTRFEAGKQAGPDTIEHFLSGGEEGHQQMANWLKGGFEMDRQGHWRLKPQVADTLQRDVQAILAQTGWQRSIDRMAQDHSSVGTSLGASIGAEHFSASAAQGSGEGQGLRATSKGTIGGSLGYNSSDTGIENETARANLDILNYDVRNAITAAEHAAARSESPERAFSDELARRVIGQEGLRARYLEDARAGRGTSDITSPLISIDQSSILRTGRFYLDLDNSPEDGDKQAD